MSSPGGLAVPFIGLSMFLSYNSEHELSQDESQPILTRTLFEICTISLRSTMIPSTHNYVGLR